MNRKLAYAAPEIADLGTVADITRGMGRTGSSDDYTCNVGNASPFNGSTGACPPGQIG